jgi:hypothetical protein
VPSFALSDVCLTVEILHCVNHYLQDARARVVHDRFGIGPTRKFDSDGREMTASASVRTVLTDALVLGWGSPMAFTTNAHQRGRGPGNGIEAGFGIRLPGSDPIGSSIFQLGSR